VRVCLVQVHLLVVRFGEKLASVDGNSTEIVALIYTSEGGMGPTLRICRVYATQDMNLPLLSEAAIRPHVGMRCKIEPDSFLVSVNETLIFKLMRIQIENVVVDLLRCLDEASVYSLLYDIVYLCRQTLSEFIDVFCGGELTTEYPRWI
jgi:hypothetical protein